MFREALDLQEPFTTKPLDYIQEDPIIREIHEDKHDKRAADADLAESGTVAQMESGSQARRQLGLLDPETHIFRDLDGDALGRPPQGISLPVRDVSEDNQRIWLQERVWKSQ